MNLNKDEYSDDSGGNDAIGGGFVEKRHSSLKND